jgi:hypothetical protein
VSDYAPGATEVLPRLAAGDSHATRPLISLIVPVWNDDELVVDLVSGLQVVPELAEWERIGKNRKERSNLRWSIPPSLRRSTHLCRLVGRFNSTRQFVRWAAVWRSVHLRSIICSSVHGIGVDLVSRE